MNKRIYWIISIVFIGMLVLNIFNDRYYMNYQLSALTVYNPVETSSSQVIIYGDETNEGIFIETPKVDLPKDGYLIKIKYNADTDLNFVSLNGKTKSQELTIEETDSALHGS